MCCSPTRATSLPQEKIVTGMDRNVTYDKPAILVYGLIGCAARLRADRIRVAAADPNALGRPFVGRPTATALGE